MARLVVLALCASPAWSAPFTPGNLIALRFGPNPTNNNAVGGQMPIFLDELSLSPATRGQVVQTIALPATDAAAAAVPPLGRSLTVTGQTSQSQGGLLRSDDARFLIFAGWNGTQQELNNDNTPIDAVTVRCDSSGSCDTTTSSADSIFGGIGNGNIRYATTADGSTFVIIGTNGIESQVLPGTGACPATRGAQCNTLISGTANYRGATTRAGTLYTTAQDGNTGMACGVYQWPGNALPASNASVPTVILNTSDASGPAGVACQTHGIVFLNDTTLAVGDLNDLANGGGVRIYKLTTVVTNGSSAQVWGPSATFVFGPDSALGVGFQHLAFDNCNSNNNFFFTTAEGTGVENSLWYMGYDAVAGLPSTPPTPVQLVASRAGVQWRGLAMAPNPSFPACPGAPPATSATATATASARPSSGARAATGGAAAAAATAAAAAVAAAVLARAH